MLHPVGLSWYVGVQKFLTLAIILALIVDPNRRCFVDGWILPLAPCSSSDVTSPSRHAPNTLLWAKKKKNTAAKKTGGGGGGFGAPAAATKKPSKKDLAKRITQQYGGTSPQDIARGTQARIDQAMKRLPNHMQVATRLYQELQRWNARLSQLSVLEHANIPPQELEGARRAQEELDNICQEYDLTTDNLHNVFQQITWDASADAKAARALTGTMSKEVREKVDNACRIVAETVGQTGKCLDVGCGYGVLVPHLKECGLDASQIYGVDLSSEMIRNAIEQHRGVQFEASDFDQYAPDTDFDAIIFCSSLHDLPNASKALGKAASLLRPQGKIVVVHPQGAAHVARQHTANPVMVQNKLPDAVQLNEMASGVGLIVEKEPAQSGSAQEEQEGYLAVLIRK